MRTNPIQPYVAIAAIVALGALVAAAGSDGGAKIGDVPLFAVCAAIAFAIQWIVFVPSFRAQTERYFDLTGSVTYMTVVVVAVVGTGDWEPRSLLIGGLVIAWAARLGWFLFTRVRREGADRRFDDLKPSFPRFLMTWTLQGLWVLLTLAAGLAAITSESDESLGAWAAIGAALWVVGFVIEAVADAQKRAFRADPVNKDRFIQQGLWRWSRHPNYFGEIVLWAGIAIIAVPALSGWQWVTMVSPVFVFVLLTRVSGIPLLEARARRRWGSEPAFREYVARTSVLIPRPPRGR